jgi:hypothetical protein
MLSRTMLLLGLVLMLPLANAVEAESAHRQKPTRQAGLDRPPKDCTRYNSRYGFYGNIWCTPAEQNRWDRWDAARLRAR